MINEFEIRAKWSPVIESATGIKDQSKINWMAKYAHFHELYEHQTSLNENNSYAFTGAVNGMNAVTLPGNPGGNFDTQVKGSGDKANSLLALSLQVAAQTVGFDLVPVVPMPGPLGVLTYMDFVYGGGKLTGEGANIPLMVKAEGPTSNQGVTNTDPVVFNYIGKSRLDGKSIYKVVGAVPPGENLQALFDGLTSTTGKALELVKALEDHITGFTTNDFTTNDGMSREAGESTMDNVMNLQLFNKSVTAKTYQVAASVTREQIQDLKQFGIDAVGQVEQVLVNELSQSINKAILDKLFKLGEKNHAAIIAGQGINFFLNISSATTTVGTAFGSKFTVVPSGTTLAASENASSPSENLHSRQRKIMSKMLAMSNMISIRGRRGPATFAVTNGQVASALQDCAGFIAAPFANSIAQNSGSLYSVGQLAGISVYVDPNMDWSDNRLCIGRKGDGNSPGLVYMPYLLAESVQMIAESTMAPKLGIKSRVALVEAGQHPENSYLTSGVTISAALGGSLI